MNRTEVDRILKEGTVKDKINLYFLNIAKSNTRAPLITDNDNSNEIYNYLSSEDNKELLKDIKLSSDLKYYNKLYSNNNTFMAFRLQITNSISMLINGSLLISANIKDILTKQAVYEYLKEVIKLVDNKPLRDNLILLTLNGVVSFNVKEYQIKGYKHYIKLLEKDIKIDYNKTVENVKNFNIAAKDSKEFIKGLLSCNFPNVPLKPYKDFLKNEENRAKKQIKSTQENIWNLLNSCEVDPELELWTPSYEDIVVEITEEDLEDIKKAGR